MVFLAPVRWRPSSCCTGFGHPINLFNSGIGALPAGKATERSDLLHSQRTAPGCEHPGGWSASGPVQGRTMAILHKPPHFMRGVADEAEVLSMRSQAG